MAASVWIPAFAGIQTLIRAANAERPRGFPVKKKAVAASAGAPAPARIPPNH